MLQRLKNFYHLLSAIAAAVFYHFPGRKLVVIGVTGTDGKTTTVNLLHHILTKGGYKAAVISTLSSMHTTTPDSWKLQKFLRQSLKNGCSHVILEVSSHAIDQNRIWGIPFAIGVLTNIAPNEHLDYHRTFENYRQIKLRFLKSCQKSITSDNWPKNFRFTTSLLGEFNRDNIRAATAAALALGLPPPVIRQGIATFKAPLGRLEVVVKRPFTVVVDFAHTPQAFEAVLPTVKKMGHRLIHVFGATGDRDKTKRPIMAEIAAKYDDQIILTHEDTYSEDPKAIIAQLEAGLAAVGYTNYGKTFDRRSAIKIALTQAKPGDVVLLTGVGHQRTINLAGKEIPWNEPKIVKEILHEL